MLDLLLSVRRVIFVHRDSAHRQALSLLGTARLAAPLPVAVFRHDSSLFRRGFTLDVVPPRVLHTSRDPEAYRHLYSHLLCTVESRGSCGAGGRYTRPLHTDFLHLISYPSAARQQLRDLDVLVFEP
jgi:hypothetical protein